MPTSYFTFGQTHVHHHEGKTLDKDIVVKVVADDPRATMFKLFGPKWAMQYDNEPPNMDYYPRGIVEI